jgi:hypothetical protein
MSADQHFKGPVIVVENVSPEQFVIWDVALRNRRGDAVDDAI